MRQHARALAEGTLGYLGCLFQWALGNAILLAVGVGLSLVLAVAVRFAETPGTLPYTIGRLVDVSLLIGSLLLVAIAVTAYVLAQTTARGGTPLRYVLLSGVAVAAFAYFLLSSGPSCDDEKRGYDECVEYWESHEQEWYEAKALGERNGYLIAAAVLVGVGAGVVTSQNPRGRATTKT